MTTDFIPLEPVVMGFWEKFFELQIRMLFISNENVQNHMYTSSPWEWLVLTRGIAYWVSPESNVIYYLTFWISWVALITDSLLFLLDWFLRPKFTCWVTSSSGIPQRLPLESIAVFWFSISWDNVGNVTTFTKVNRLSFTSIKRFFSPNFLIKLVGATEAWNQFRTTGEVLLVGYVFHFLPYFFVDHTLFLHHYLPALAFKLLLNAALVEHLYYLTRLVRGLMNHFVTIF